MALQSRGQLILADTTPSFATRFQGIPSGFELTGLFSSYANLYKQQLWVYTLINKLALNTARLPLRAYKKTSTGRDDQRDTPFGKLLDNPNTKHSPFFLWTWTVSTLNIYGEALWVKFRDNSGQVVEVAPLHPANVFVQADPETGKMIWLVTKGSLVAVEPQLAIPEDDIVHFKTFHPDNPYRGLSPLEPLRLTLVTEYAARRAQNAYWQNGAQPAMFLSHPAKLGKDAMERLKANWDSVHGSVDNFGKTAILEEGMEPKTIAVTPKDAMYIDQRHLAREEVCAAYDVPPPAVHILDRATFSNITEQMRSVYRDTMAPRLKMLESTLDVMLRPEFGDTDLYAEFDMDDVLRANQEDRMNGYATAIGHGILTPAEARERENLPFEEHTDRVFLEAKLIPIEETSRYTSPQVGATDVVLGPAEPPVPKVSSPAVPSAPVAAPGAPKPAAPPPGGKAKITQAELRALMGRLGRVATLGDVDVDDLTAGMNGGTEHVRSAYNQARLRDEGVPGFKARIAEMLEEAE